MEANGSSLRLFPQTGEDEGPCYYADSFPDKLSTHYVKQWEADHPEPYGKEPLTGNMVYEGHDWDDLKPHLSVFFHATKTRQPVIEDAVFGNHAALACHMANESYFQKKQVFWNEQSRAITS